MLDFPEKISLVGGQQVNRHLHFFGVAATFKQFEVFTKSFQLMSGQSLAQSSGHQRFFGIGHGNAGGFKNKALKLGKLGPRNRFDLHLQSFN
ncbi:hypothetical protein GALL_462770 [mine drainage metagenome]|uniref:Uncharacterized protein n=1 Tax=mine drainage metagenome TaxID=410659 RepID=A0A1J5Q3R2_9ZZZZ